MMKCYICQGKPLLFLPFGYNFTLFPSTRHTIMFFTYNCCYIHLTILTITLAIECAFPLKTYFKRQKYDNEKAFLHFLLRAE